MAETDYVLGTHDDEIARLGLQHRVWRDAVTAGWQRAGITEGWQVLDVGAGPAMRRQFAGQLGPVNFVVDERQRNH